MPQEPTIRPMTADDAEPASDVLVGGGWGDRRAFFRFAIAHPSLSPLVAEADGRIAGTGIATINGSVGWVGMIFVDEALRGRGIGTALTAAVIDRLEAAGCTSLMLLASPLGRPIYERLGFVAEMDYRLLVADGQGAARPSATLAAEATGDRAPTRLRPLSTADLPAILALDRAATGEDRGHLLRAVTDAATTVVVEGPSGQVVAFDARAPWGTHPTIAPALVDGVRLVEARRARAPDGAEVRTALPEANRHGIATLENLGWRGERGLTRMVRGVLVRWDPQAIWGQFNYAIG
jgi:GNAT superfamily N-acetyltransferase